MVITDAMERRKRRTWLVLTEHAKTCPDRSSNPVSPEHTPYKIVLCHTKVIEEGWIYRLGGGKKRKIFVRKTSREVIIKNNAKSGKKWTTYVRNNVSATVILLCADWPKNYE
jgi:hypothetical protein